MDEEMLWIDSSQGACLRQEQRQTSFQIAPFQNRSPFAQEYSTDINAGVPQTILMGTKTKDKRKESEQLQLNIKLLCCTCVLRMYLHVRKGR